MKKMSAIKHRHSHLRIILSYLTALWLVVGCEERRQLKEMHDSTGQMNKTTLSMDQTMKEMNTTMGKMQTTMSNMDQTMKGMNGNMTGMYGTMNGMNNTMDGMNGTMKTMNGTMVGMDKTMVGMDSTMHGMNDTMRGMDSNMTGMHSTMKGMNSTMKGMSSTMTNMDGTMVKMNDQLGGMDGKMGNLVEQITGMNGVIKVLGADMKAMSGKLDGMTAKMSDLLGKMNEIYDVARPGMAMMLRGQALDAVKSNVGLPAKVSAAAKYYMAFDYQLQSANNEQEESKRINLANVAAAEFFRELKMFLPEGAPTDKTLSLTGANEEIEALAVAMHRSNEVQDEMLQHHTNIKKLTMYSMIVEALKAKVEIDNGKLDYNQVPEYIKTILVDSPIAVWLLDVRMNTMVKMMLGRVAPVAPKAATDVKIISKIKNAAATFLSKEWQLQPEKQEVSLLEEIHRYLMAASEAKLILQQVGHPTELKTMLSSGLSHMSLNASSDKDKDKINLDERRTKIVEDLARYQTFLVKKESQ